jgi:hypothetical protein
MGFEPPKFLQQYLDKEWRKPPENFVNCSLYYANLNPFFINYMTRVVRPCMAYSCGSADGLLNSGIKMNVGYTLKKSATRLIKGDKTIFEGNDIDAKILSEYWATSVDFDTFLETAIDYMLDGATVIKLNKDANGRCVPVATRCDRYYATTDENGNICHIVLLNSFLFTEKYGNSTEYSYWLVEERYFKNGKPYVRYKVQHKSGTAGQEVLPTVNGDGIGIRSLPETVRNSLKLRGISALNKEMQLPFRDGLGCWTLRRTATNSCVPGLAMGDPLLYGALDILWAIDVVFSGSIVDVILGKGKILVPKKYLQSIRDDFKAMGFNDTKIAKFANTSFMDDDDDSLVYIYTEHDKDFTPQSVQFDIRAEQYKGMLEIYLRQLAVHCGFAPASVFPFLADNSTKTATEVTAEENLTRGTVQTSHQRIAPTLERLLNEVLYQLYKDLGVEYKDHIKIKLSDYIGNPLQRDQNIRENVMAGLMPKDVGIQRINNISDAETQEYIRKIAEEEARTQEPPFNDMNYFGDDDGNSEQTAELSSDRA